MFARLAAAALALLAAGPASAQRDLPAGPPVRQFLAACDGKDGWSDPSPPVRIFGNVYHVGTCGITALLIVGNEGLILIDGGPADAARLVADNIVALGFKLQDVKWIVASHEHHDHVGGLAELKGLTGASLAARAAQKGPLEAGRLDWRDPQAALNNNFPPVTVDRVMPPSARASASASCAAAPAATPAIPTPPIPTKRRLARSACRRCSPRPARPRQSSGPRAAPSWCGWSRTTGSAAFPR